MLTRHCAVAICVAADAPILLAYQWPGHLFFDRRGPTSAVNGVESPRWLYRDGHSSFGRVTKSHAKEVTQNFLRINMGVSENSGTPKSSILIGFSIENHPSFWGTPIFGNTHMTFEKSGVPGNSASKLPFLGMVEVKCPSTVRLGEVSRDLQGSGMKLGYELNHLGGILTIFCLLWFSP